MKQLILAILFLSYLSCKETVVGSKSGYSNDEIKIEGSYERANSSIIYYGAGNVKLKQLYFGKDVKPTPSEFVEINSDSIFYYAVIWNNCTIRAPKSYIVHENMLIRPENSDTFFIEKELDTLRLYQIKIISSSSNDYIDRGYRKSKLITNYLPVEGNFPLAEWPLYCNE
jgi:hypothetical protein